MKLLLAAMMLGMFVLTACVENENACAEHGYKTYCTMGDGFPNPKTDWQYCCKGKITENADGSNKIDMNQYQYFNDRKFP